MNTLSVRPATAADVPGVLALFTRFAEEDSVRDPRHAFASDAAARYRNDLPDWISSDAHAVFVAEDGAVVAGFCRAALWYPPALYAGGREAFLSEVYVVPEARRRGVARRLIAAVQAWAEQRGAARLRALVLDANAPSQALWRDVGAEPLAHVFALELDPSAPDRPARGALGFGT